MEELAVVSPWDLRDDPGCAERLRRRLAGDQGRFVANPRFQIMTRLRGDISLAHSELRRPTPKDFPDPEDLFEEERAVYRAAANGYLALFGTTNARTIDVDRFKDFPEFGVQLRANPGIVVELADHSIQVRSLRAAARTPTVRINDVYALALLLHEHFAETPIELVATDLLALELDSQRLVLDDFIEPAMAWLASRLAVIRAAAQIGGLQTGVECNDCPFVWKCPAFESIRRR